MDGCDGDSRTFGSGHVHDRSDDYECQKNEEQNFGHACRCPGQTGKSEEASDQSNDQENESPMQHNVIRFAVI